MLQNATAGDAVAAAPVVRCDAFATAAAPQRAPAFCVYRDDDVIVVARSDDAGRTWRTTAEVPAADEGLVNGAFVVPVDGGTAVAFVTDDAIHASVDGGATFRTVGSNSNFRPESVSPFRSLANSVGADGGAAFLQAPLSMHGATVYSTNAPPRPVSGAPTYNVRFVFDASSERTMAFAYDGEPTRPGTRGALTLYECDGEVHCVRGLRDFGGVELRYADTIASRLYAVTVDSEGRLRFVASDDGGRRWSDWQGVNKALSSMNALPGRRFRSAAIAPVMPDGRVLLLRASVESRSSDGAATEAVFRSSDGGRSWRLLAASDEGHGAAVRPLPWRTSRASLGAIVATVAVGGDGTAYAVADRGVGDRTVSALYCSRDGGSRWEPCGAAAPRADRTPCTSCSSGPVEPSATRPGTPAHGTLPTSGGRASGSATPIPAPSDRHGADEPRASAQARRNERDPGVRTAVTAGALGGLLIFTAAAIRVVARRTSSPARQRDAG